MDEEKTPAFAFTSEEEARAWAEREWAKEGPLPYVIAHRILRNTHDSDDVAQKVFLSFLTKWPTIWQGSERGWVARAARNAALNVLRDQKPYVDLDPDTLGEDTGQTFEVIEAEEVIRAFVKERWCLLPTKGGRNLKLEAEVFRAIEGGLTNKRAARELGISYSTLTNRKKQFRDELRKWLEENEGCL